MSKHRCLFTFALLQTPVHRPAHLPACRASRPSPSLEASILAHANALHGFGAVGSVLFGGGQP